MNVRSTRAALVVLTLTGSLALAACGDDGGSGEADGGETGGQTGGEAGGQSEAELITDGTLVVAMSGEFQPFSYFEGNELTGFDFEIGQAVAEEMGLEMQGEAATFASLIGGLQANRYDVLVASMTPTEERAQAVDFTQGYYSSGAQLFVPAGEECTDPTQLDNPTIGVATGTTYAEYLANEGADMVGEVRTFDSDVVALQDLGTGRLDAVMTDRLVGLYQIEEAGLDVVECGEPLYSESPAFAVKKGNTGLVEELNTALDAIVEDGTYAEISEKYFGTDISDTAGEVTELGDSDSATSTDG